MRSLFAGKCEAVELPPKQVPGRPPKRVRTREEDAVVAALQSRPDQHEALDEHLRVRHRKRKADCMERGEVLGS